MRKVIKKIDKDYEITEIIRAKENKNYQFQIPLAKFLNFGYYLISPLIMGIFFGYILDNIFGKKLFIKIFLVLGIIGLFYNFYKSINEIKKIEYDRN